MLLAKGDKEDGRLEVREIFGMDLKANLVVLSGCDTGLGKVSTGDEFVGLTRAFIYAGTPSVVASLWSVDDSSTAQLMASFYRNLKTMSKVEALRQAQLELIRGEGQQRLTGTQGSGGNREIGRGCQLRAPCSKLAINLYVSSLLLGAVYFSGGREMNFVPSARYFGGGSGAGGGTLPCFVRCNKALVDDPPKRGDCLGFSVKKILKKSSGIKRLRIGVRLPLLASFCDPITRFATIDNLK